MVKLDIDGLCFSYGKRHVLKDVSIKPTEGEVLGVIGPNGSGKTTLFRCVSGLLKPNKGTISIDGTDTRRLGRTTLSKRVGFLPQGSIAGGNLTVFETVLLGMYPRLGWRVKKEEAQKVHDVLHRLSLGGFATRNVKELSGGEQHRTLIAQTLVKEPNILLLDEPTSSLDLRHQFETCRIIREATVKMNSTTLISIHDLNLAARYSDRLILMNKGRVFTEGAPDVVLTEENIKEVYGVDVKVIRDGTVQVIPRGPSGDKDI